MKSFLVEDMDLRNAINIIALDRLENVCMALDPAVLRNVSVM